jgi:hypothetical protein
VVEFLGLDLEHPSRRVPAGRVAWLGRSGWGAARTRPDARFRSQDDHSELQQPAVCGKWGPKNPPVRASAGCRGRSGSTRRPGATAD